MTAAWELDMLARSQWKATYDYVRVRWHKTSADAEDITQEFFLRAIDKNVFDRYDPEQARLSTFVRVCVDRMVVDRRRRNRTKKRGGGVAVLSLDANAGDEELDRPGSLDPEEPFAAEWLRGVFRTAVELFRATCARRGKVEHFRVFQLFHLSDEADRPSYEAIASELGITVRDVNNRLTFARREFRAALIEALRACTASEEEMHDEAQSTLGIGMPFARSGGLVHGAARR